ncbi:unnamed protein product [Triticum turgidum subsp. durum]|uniref:Cyanate lyase C-terminal domain-containing protein n=1 Tax=Triticum turgidum subsp. durum TaxID=4567 RepID=A0A9R0UWX3_TRITD|nr:unnamed protein product [Triticum turgidum subsp. durum]
MDFRKQFRKVGVTPLAPNSLVEVGPEELGRRAREKDVVSILHRVAQGAHPVPSRKRKTFPVVSPPITATLTHHEVYNQRFVPCLTLPPQRFRRAPRGQSRRTADGQIMEESGASAAAVVPRLLAAKEESGKSFSDIAAETGLTNVYVAQLKPDMAPAFRAAVPALTDELGARDYCQLLQTLTIAHDVVKQSASVLCLLHLIIHFVLNSLAQLYHAVFVQSRLNEAVMHFGESIKEIINEDFGDGIMSAIDFYCSVDKIQGADGKDRVVVTFDGKYLPYTEQEQMNIQHINKAALKYQSWIEFYGRSHNPFPFRKDVKCRFLNLPLKEFVQFTS